MPNRFTILVAEDDENDRFLLQRASQQAGINIPIHFVNDGQEAVDYLEARDPRPQPAEPPSSLVLLLDLKMPRLDGFQVLEWIGARPTFKRMPVIVFSSSSNPEDMRRALELGASSFRVKPQHGSEYVLFFQDLARQITQTEPPGSQART